MELITVNSEAGGGAAVQVRGHRLMADLHPADGGRDLGLAPSELLAASLGSCIAIMVEDYCRRQGCRPGAVRVDVAYELAGEPRRIVALTIDVETPPDLPAKKKAAVRRIAEKCPVHATLESPPMIDIEIL